MLTTLADGEGTRQPERHIVSINETEMSACGTPQWHDNPYELGEY